MAISTPQQHNISNITNQTLLIYLLSYCQLSTELTLLQNKLLIYCLHQPTLFTHCLQLSETGDTSLATINLGMESANCRRHPNPDYFRHHIGTSDDTDDTRTGLRLPTMTTDTVTMTDNDGTYTLR